MNNTGWSEDEMKIVTDAMVGRIPAEALIELLPGRTIRAIQKKLRGMAPDQREHAGLPVLDPDDDGMEDGELSRRRISGRLGSQALLRALQRAGFA